MHWRRLGDREVVGAARGYILTLGRWVCGRAQPLVGGVLCAHYDFVKTEGRAWGSASSGGGGAFSAARRFDLRRFLFAVRTVGLLRLSK